MKNARSTVKFARASASALLCLLAAAALAAPVPDDAAKARARDFVSQLDQDYNFTPAQKEQVLAIFEKQQAEIAAIRTDASLSDAAKKKR